MKYGRNNRRATALIRRQRDVEKYEKLLGKTLAQVESTLELLENESPQQAFARFVYTYKRKLKIALQEVETLKERIE